MSYFSFRLPSLTHLETHSRTNQPQTSDFSSHSKQDFVHTSTGVIRVCPDLSKYPFSSKFHHQRRHQIRKASVFYQIFSLHWPHREHTQLLLKRNIYQNCQTSFPLYRTYIYRTFLNCTRNGCKSQFLGDISPVHNRFRHCQSMK
jgi:hypothetical protein